MYAYGLGVTLESSLLLSPGGLSDSELAAWSGLQTWLDPKYLASLTLGAAPTLSTWAGANWAGSGLGPYTHTAGSTADLTSATLISGNRYRFSWSVSGRTVGTVTKKFGTATDGGARSANGAYTDEATADAVGDTWTPTSDFDGAVTVASGSNISLTSIAPRAGALASAFTQATAANMPWIDSTTGAIRFDGTADNAPYSGAASDFKFLHNGEMHVFVVGKFTSVVGYRPLASTYSVEGMILRNVTGTTSLQLYIKNSACAVSSYTTVGAITPGTFQIFEGYTSGGSCYTAVNGVGTSAASGFVAGAAGSITPPQIGRRGSNYFEGEVGDVLIFNRALTDLERARLTRKLATKWGIAL